MTEPVAMKERMVDEDIPAVPVGGPSPAAPAPAAPTAEVETQIYAGIPSQTHIDARVYEWRVSSPTRWSPCVCGIVIRHIPDIRVDRLDGDLRLTALILRGDGLLGCRTERPPRLGVGPHPLHRLHHVGLLSEKGVAELSGPTDVLGQAVEYIGERDQPLHTGIPVLFFRLGHELGGLPVRMVPHPLLGFGNLYGVSGSGQHL